MLDRHLEPDEDDPFDEDEDPDLEDDEDEYLVAIAEHNYECLIYREPELKIIWRT